jgi:hypothetical protein
MQAEAIKLIDKCIEVLERDGWRVGAYNYYDDQPHCLVGALYVAAYGYGDPYELSRRYRGTEVGAIYAYTYRRIAEHLTSHIPALARHSSDMLPEGWNDAMATSKEEVIEMLHHCKFHMLRNAEQAVRPWPELQSAAA